MVRRGLRYLAWLSGAVLLLMLAVAGWLLGTSSGSEWLLARLNQQGQARIVAEVGGSLWGGLDLSDLRIDWPGGRLAADRIKFRWQPTRLVAGRLAVDTLELGEVRIILETSPESGLRAETPHPSVQLGTLWLQLPAWLLGAAADIQHFSLGELSIGSPSAELLDLGDLAGAFHYAAGALRAEQLHMRLPCGTWDGAVGLDLRQRQVMADLLWKGAPIIADWDRVHTVVSLDEDFSGTLHGELLAGGAERIALTAEAKLSLSGVVLTDLVATRSDARDRVSGTLDIVWSEKFNLTGDLRLEHLNLAAEAGWPTDLSGALQAELDTAGYSGRVDLESGRPGLERGSLAAEVTGDWRGLRLTDISAGWLDGRLAGDLDLNWRGGFRLSGSLQGSGLDPASLVPGMSGQLQLAASGGLQISPAGELSAHWDADLDRSRLRNRPLSGHVAGRWQQNDLLLEDLELQGDGMRVKGSGQLSRRLDFRLQVVDLSRLVENWRGGMTADGWLARPNAQWIGAGAGELTQLVIDQLQAETGLFRLDYPGAASDSQLKLTLTGLKYAQLALDQVVLRGAGQLRGHELEFRLDWPSGELAGKVSGGWLDPDWSGELLTLTGSEEAIGGWRLESPAQLTISRDRFEVPALQLVGEQRGRIRLSADLKPRTFAGTAQADWQELPLEFLDPWLAGPSLAGTASGTGQFELQPDGALKLKAELSSAPTLELDGRRLAFADSRVSIDWDAGGLKADGRLGLDGGGALELELNSPEPGRLQLPVRGSLAASWNQIDLRQAAPWLPPTITLSGAWNGSVAGNWAPSAPFHLSGRTWLAEGGLQWQSADGVVDLPLRQAELSGDWQNGLAEGRLDVELGAEGRINGRFRLPVGPADTATALDAEVSFAVREIGLLMLAMPGVVNETHGNLKGDLRLAGTWARPELFGTVALRDAGGDVPTLGLALRDAEFDLSFDKTALRLERLQVRSGEGRLTGSGSLQLSGWQPERWSAMFKGENVQLVHLPEFTLEATPDLKLSGSQERLTVRGEVLVPTLLASEIPRDKMIEPSEDVVLVDAPAEKPSRVFTELDVDLKVQLGDHVAVKAKGLDARLEGGVVIATNQRGAFIGQGEIRVAQGHYAAYGLKLPITRGRAAFGGGALESPNLDVLAERTVGEVKAGVRVTGTPRKPVVKLVSDPTLPDTEILSYIVLGRPLNATGGEQDNLMLAAGALLSQGESAALQEKLKRSFGLDTLEVQSGGEEGVEGSMVAVGKYLTPELYLSFGQSLFTRESVARLRYQLSQRWELESQFGTVSGADLSYRIEFR